MKARIYSPSKNAMQSGGAGAPIWVVELESQEGKAPEPLMGWTQAGDTASQISLRFDTLEKAEAFAQGRGLDYTVLKNNVRKVKPRNYGDNFKYIPPQIEE